MNITLSDTDIEISTYSVNADIIKPDRDERAAEINRVKKHIDVAHHLGLKRMRHDVASFRRPFSTNGMNNFIKELPLMVEGTRELHDYAASFGIHTTLENHTDWGPVGACLVIASFPVILLYIFFSDKIGDAMAYSGMKN